MRLSALLVTVKETFLSLSRREQFLCTARVGSPFVGVIFCLVALLGPIRSQLLEECQLVMNSVNVGNGLFTQARNNLGDNIAFTTSEVDVLTQYIQSEVESAPQHVLLGLWMVCVGNATEDVDWVFGKNWQWQQTSTPGAISWTCLPSTVNYVLDYRRKLVEIGLSIILQYAYTSYEDMYSLAYDHYVHHLLVLKRFFWASCMVYVVCLMVACGIACVLYLRSGLDRGLERQPKWTQHVAGSCAIAGALLLMVGSSLITALVTATRHRVTSELGDFGIYLAIGRRWMSVVWITVGLATANAAAWGGPLWCANPKASPVELDSPTTPLSPVTEENRSSEEGASTFDFREYPEFLELTTLNRLGSSKLWSQSGLRTHLVLRLDSSRLIKPLSRLDSTSRVMAMVREERKRRREVQRGLFGGYVQEEELEPLGESGYESGSTAPITDPSTHPSIVLRDTFPDSGTADPFRSQL